MTAPDGSIAPDARRRQRGLVLASVVVAILLVIGVAVALGDGGGDDAVSTTSTSGAPVSSGAPSTTLRFDAPPSQPLGTATTTSTVPPTTTSTTTTTASAPPPVTAPPVRARPGPTIESSAGKHQALRAALAEAETRWAQQDRAGGYVFRTQRRCFCPATDNEIEVDASGAVVGQRNRSGDPEPDPPTVDDVFASISGAIAADAAEIVVSFDRDAGFPVDLTIDFDGAVADDEQGRRIEWLVLRPPS